MHGVRFSFPLGGPEGSYLNGLSQDPRVYHDPEGVVGRGNRPEWGDRQAESRFSGGFCSTALPLHVALLDTPR